MSQTILGLASQGLVSVATDPGLHAKLRVLVRRSNVRVAETNKEIPAKAKPAYKLPVLCRIKPTMYGPTNPPRLAIDVIKAMPDAAETPVRNSPGIEK
jgi:hypothetical protein